MRSFPYCQGEKIKVVDFTGATVVRAVLQTKIKGSFLG